MIFVLIVDIFQHHRNISTAVASAADVVVVFWDAPTIHTPSGLPWQEIGQEWKAKERMREKTKWPNLCKFCKVRFFNDNKRAHIFVCICIRLSYIIHTVHVGNVHANRFKYCHRNFKVIKCILWILIQLWIVHVAPLAKWLNRVCQTRCCIEMSVNDFLHRHRTKRSACY